MGLRSLGAALRDAALRLFAPDRSTLSRRVRGVLRRAPSFLRRQESIRRASATDGAAPRLQGSPGASSFPRKREPTPSHGIGREIPAYAGMTARGAPARWGRGARFALIGLALAAAGTLAAPPAAMAQQSSDANLASIAFTDNDGGTLATTLSPAFAAATTSYTLSVSAGAPDGEVTFAPTANDAGASFAISPADANASKNGHQVDVGTSNATVTVTAADSTTKAYAFDVRYDYDDDNDGYIDVRTRAQLHAIRDDLNSNGDQGNISAFPHALSGSGGARFGCPSSGCVGYELRADIDLSTGGNWSPIGGNRIWHSFTGKFRGNGHTISNMTIGSGSPSGLFQRMGTNGVVEGVGLLDVNITRGVGSEAGAVSGTSGGLIRNVYATGSIDIGSSNVAGGLVGWHTGTIRASWADVAVTGSSRTGGMVGYDDYGGQVRTSYSIGPVTQATSQGTHRRGPRIRRKCRHLLSRRRDDGHRDGGDGQGAQHVRSAVADGLRLDGHLFGLGRAGHRRGRDERRRVGLRNVVAVSRIEGGRAQRGGAVRAAEPRPQRHYADRRGGATHAEPGVRRGDDALCGGGVGDAGHGRADDEPREREGRLHGRVGQDADGRERRRRGLPGRALRDDDVQGGRHGGERRSDEDLRVHGEPSGRLRRRQRRVHRHSERDAVERDAARLGHGRERDARGLAGGVPQPGGGNGLRAGRPRRQLGHARSAVLPGLRVAERHRSGRGRLEPDQLDAYRDVVGAVHGLFHGERVDDLQLERSRCERRGIVRRDAGDGRAGGVDRRVRQDERRRPRGSARGDERGNGQVRVLHRLRQRSL